MTLFVKSIEKNKLVETAVPFQLIYCPPKVETSKQLSSEVLEEVRRLKESVDVLQSRVDEMERNEKVSAVEFFPREETVERKESDVMSYTEYQGRDMRRLEERLDKAEEEIRAIKEFLKVKPEDTSELRIMKQEHPSELNLSKPGL